VAKSRPRGQYQAGVMARARATLKSTQQGFRPHDLENSSHW
jgi:hypothetical protein